MDTEFYTVPRLSSKPRFTYLGAGSALLTCAVTHAASAASGGLAARRAVRPPAAMQSLLSRSATAHTSLPLLFVRARPLPAPSAVPQLAASTLYVVSHPPSHSVSNSVDLIVHSLRVIILHFREVRGSTPRSLEGSPLNLAGHGHDRPLLSRARAVPPGLAKPEGSHSIDARCSASGRPPGWGAPVCLDPRTQSRAPSAVDG